MKKGLAIVVVCCSFVLALGLAACGGSSSGSAASGSAASGVSGSAASASTSGSASGASAEASADGYLDSHGLINAKALTELDGAELTKLAESAGYQWDEKHAEWTKVGSDVAPMKGLTKEQSEAGGTSISDTSKYDFTQDEVAGFAAGGKGTPVRWMLSCKGKYADAAEYLADQNVEVVEQCDVEQRYGGTHIWAIVKNSAGDRFLMDVEYVPKENSGQVDVYTSDYITTNSRGIASAFSLGEYLLEDKHTIDEAFEVIKSGEVS